MESEEENIVKALKVVLHDHFENVNATQEQLKALLIGLDAKVETLAAKSNGLGLRPLPSTMSNMASVTEHVSRQGTASKSRGSNSATSPVTSAVSGTPSIVHFAEQANSEKYFEASTWGSQFLRDTAGTKSEAEEQEVLPLRSGFQDAPAKRSLGSKINMARARQHSTVMALDSEVCDLVNTEPPHTRFRAMSPDSLARRILDVIGITMVLYDAFMVPFWLAWGFTWTVGFWTTCIFWTIDLPTQFITGFRNKEQRLEQDLGKAALYYAKTWFFLDVTVVLCDWIAALGNVSETMKYLRVMRLVRGARQVMRFFLVLQKYKLSSQYLEVHLSMDITLLLAFILWVNHCVGCGWYRVGLNADSDTGWTWVREAGVSDVGMQYEYSTSLHWALTQMTPASMEVVPECTVERAFNVLIIVAGMILGSVFAATLTSSMTQYRLYKEKVSNNFMQLQSYLAQQGVEPELSLAVKMHVRAQLRTRQRLKWKNVAYLDFASKSLKEALWHSCCLKCIRKHALMHALNLYDAVAMNALCNSAMATATYSRGDIIFEVGVEAKDGFMHYIVLGSMFYDPGIMAAENDHASEDPKLNLASGSFVSEAALWVEWRHLGTLFVRSASEVLQLHSKNLSESLSHRFPDVMAIITQYAIVFHASLHEPGATRSELGCSVDNLDLMAAMDTPIRIGLAEPILDQLRKSRAGFGQKKGVTKDLNNLHDEIQEGKCNLGIEHEEPVRTVFVVALKLWRESQGDDRFLVKVGEYSQETGEFKAGCVLPGTKRKGKETARAAIDKLFATELEALVPAVTVFPGCTKTVFLKNSPTYGVRTRYLRTTYNASLDAKCEFGTAIVDWDATASQNRRPSHESASIRLQNEWGCRYRFCRWLKGVRSKMRHTLQFHSGETEDPESAAKEKVSARQVTDILRQQVQAKLLPSGSKTTINIWLTQEEFNALQQEAATPLIQSWLESVQLREGGPLCAGSESSGTGLRDGSVLPEYQSRPLDDSRDISNGTGDGSEQVIACDMDTMPVPELGEAELGERKSSTSIPLHVESSDVVDTLEHVKDDSDDLSF